MSEEQEVEDRAALKEFLKTHNLGPDLERSQRREAALERMRSKLWSTFAAFGTFLIWYAIVPSQQPWIGKAPIIVVGLAMTVFGLKKTFQKPS